MTTNNIHIDFETYSEAGYWFDDIPQRWKSVAPNKPGIGGVGAWIYSAHPSTDIISLAYGDSLWLPGMPPPVALFEAIRDGGLLWAHNSFFEFSIWANVATVKLGWPEVPVTKFRCSMACSKAFGLPGSLGKIGGALKLDIVKDTAGGALIRKLCCPRSPTKNNSLQRLTYGSNPADFDKFFRYNYQDVKAEQAITAVIPPLTPREEALWLIDQQINARGVHVDKDSLENCLSIYKQAAQKYTEELQEITGGAAQTVNELDNIRGWMRATEGVQTTSLDKAHVESLLNQPDLPFDVRRVLEIRQILGSASVKKLFTIQRYLAGDNRIRGLFAYYGAERTGRFAGRGPQPQNMPANGPPVNKCGACGAVQWSELKDCCGCGSHDHLTSTDWGIEAIECALADISTRQLSHIERSWGNPLTVISGCLRGLFSAAPGKEFICSDYSAIEAVVIAALAGEEWRLEVFRTHGKIYEMSAAKISGVPFEEIIAYKKTHGQHHPLRKKIGKVAELASGFGGWIGAWKNFGADKFMDDNEIKQSILKWREDSPAIVELWGGQWRQQPGHWKFTREFYGLEGAAVMAVMEPGKCFSYREITYGVKDDVLYCKLPSGRHLVYHKPKLSQGVDPRGLDVQQLSFMGWNSNPANGAIGWIRIDTYSGKLAENVVQAVARDILCEAMPRLEAAGYPIVLHVHDEPCSEVPEGYGSVEEYERLMMIRPPWAADWPIKAAGGWRGKRYRK